MSLLGTVIRTRPADLPEVCARLATLPGADLALNPGDGRLVVLLEDADASGPTPDGHPPESAAAQLARIAQWPEVLAASLVWEYSGTDAPPPAGADQIDYRAWRGDSATPR
ncbi:chaperone NapD [Ideonella livida]|uniref:Chaperone NapD n=1 Tax=Ideonella livida TaxID=2707176 RepID=A0A7C9PGR7_9BURK|nr:chaperone NapD [Ideonella livida]NDY91493.1 chaperone NapD [Ideonella livida]